FIITEKVRQELLNEDPNSEDIIFPILRGRDIKNYEYIPNNLYIINTHNGYVNNEGEEVQPVDINLYPAIKNHLDEFYPRLVKRTDQGITPYNLRSLAYMESFYEKKIIYPNMTKYLPFYLDLETILVNPKCYILTGENLEYLTAFLNSKLFKIAYRNNFPELQGGTRELHKIYFTELAVKKISEQENIRFKELVDLIQDGKK